jgi:hypothetical protein
VGRAVGVVLALGATALGASADESGHVRVELLLLIATLGAVTAAQLAAMGRVSADTGEPLVAGALNLQAGLALLVLLALLTHGATPHTDGPPPQSTASAACSRCSVPSVLWPPSGVSVC